MTSTRTHVAVQVWKGSVDCYHFLLINLDAKHEPQIQSLRTAFTLNTALKRLFLSSTNMNSAGAIALAEFLPESNSLLHLDLTNNNLDIAGVMALSSGLKANHVMRCMDVNIPPGDEAFARMCRDILNTCIRNTEDAERSAKAASQEGQGGGSGRGLGKGVWGMIEESELAKSIRLDEEKRVSYPAIPTEGIKFTRVQIESDILVRGRACVTELTQVVGSARLLKPPSGASEDSMATDIAASTRGIIGELATAIQETEDPVRLEELLEINDQLLGLLKKLPTAGKTSKPILSLSGLGVSLNGGTPGTNGIVNGSNVLLQDVAEDDDGEVEDTPTTPRVDKGKRRADPEPEEIEKVLSPAFLISETSEDEDEDPGYGTPPEEGEIPGMPSPTDR